MPVGKSHCVYPHPICTDTVQRLVVRWWHHSSLVAQKETPKQVPKRKVLTIFWNQKNLTEKIPMVSHGFSLNLCTVLLSPHLLAPGRWGGRKMRQRAPQSPQGLRHVSGREMFCCGAQLHCTYPTAVPCSLSFYTEQKFSSSLIISVSLGLL